MSTKEGKPFRVAVAGFGTVGQGVVRLLEQEALRYHEDLGVHLDLVGVLDRSHEKKNTDWLASAAVEFTDSLEDFLGLEADVVVELIGGMDPAGEIIQRALQEGRVDQG